MTSRRLVGGGELEHTDMDLEKSGIVYKSISAERKSLGLRRRWGGDMVVYKQLLRTNQPSPGLVQLQAGGNMAPRVHG